MEDLTGKQLGAYQIVTPLGEGGMAAVYKAYQPSMDRYVALKILPRHFASDPQFISRFSQEARVIANLQHPHILPVHDFGEADGYTYLVMRFVEGGTLSDLLIEQVPLPMHRIRSIISQVGGALDYAHAQGVIHRDVKPSNVLVDQWENCLLTDFGLAKMVASTAHLTQTGGILGTPAYMSPEQGMGLEIDHRSDIYSLGVVLYQMALGFLPYQAETPMAVVIKHIHDPLPPPRQRDPNLPEAVERVILKSLAKNPEDRFDSAGEMVKALQRATEAVAPAGAETPASDMVTSVPVAPKTRPTPTPTPAVTEPAETVTARRRDSARVKRADETPSPGTTPTPSRKSKLPWALLGIGVIAVAALIFLALSGAFDGGGEEEMADGRDITVPGGADVAEDDAGPSVPIEASGSLDEILQGVEIAYSEGDIRRAHELLNEAISLEPEMAELYCQRGYTMRDLEAYSEAVADFEQCKELSQEQGMAELHYEASGMLVMAEAQAALFERDDPDAALDIVGMALEDPAAPGWLNCERGEMNLHLENREAALADFERCQTSENLDEYWTVRSQTAVLELKGGAALDQEDYPAAVEFFRRWVELEPQEPWPYCLLGEAHSGLNEFEPARVSFEHCRERSEEPEVQKWAATGIWVVQAHEARAHEDWDAAIAALSEAIGISPDEGWLHCERAEFFLSIEAHDEARRDAQTCLDVSGDDMGVREWAESLLRDLGG